MATWLQRLKEYGNKITELWSKLSINQKVLFGGAALMIIIAAGVLFFNSNKVQYETLFSDLEEKDAAEIVTKLDEDKIPYQLEDNGRTILVPAEYKYKTRLNLASENLPGGEAGFELFQSSSFGETQSDKKVKYQAALQGELARTIQGLEKVKSARVHLVMPEPTLFSENEESPSASIAITTKDNENLSPKEIQGIVNLVANSVEKLDPEDVVIVDQNGNLISDNLPQQIENSTDLIRQQMAMKKEYEKQKQADIQSMLDQSLGKNNSVVRVNVDLNFNHQEQTDEKYTHDEGGPFVRSEQVTTESGTNQAAQPEGVPGTDTNIPEYTQVETQNGNSTYDKSSKTRNYELNKTQTVTKFAQGDVRYDYLTVSVLVNNANVSKMNLGDTEAARVEKIRNIVATACGLRENRENETVNLKDNISVAFIDFYTEPEPETQASGLFGKLSSNPLMAGALAAICLAIILAAWWIYRRRQPALEEIEEDGQEFETVVEDEINIEDLIDDELTPEQKEKQKIRMEVEKLVDEDAESAVQVIRAWLLEDSR
ncbi:MAG: flagellar basal-body MS-ring/collar protein FliF [Syntrophomonadaceae bacterium]|jgi:flagellar M-ring protein FliF